MLTLPNYQIGSQIYQSVNSIVYRAQRKTDNQPVILKMLKLDYPAPAELTRYRQEYEIIHDLDLAGVINTYGIEKYQNTLVIILEDFGGKSLKATFEKGEQRRISVSDFLPLAIQIADSLGNLHAVNIIHKDINPSNIVVNVETNQLKIIDFGIASRLPRENPTLKNPEQLEGTLAYISPEQTGRMNRSVDYRTDLYSLGVTCYELLTGSVPFTAADAMELVHCHIAKTPSPVCEVNPDVPPIVSDLVMKLLAKNASDRYQSAFGLKADLEKCLENWPGLSFELAQNDFSGKLQIPQKLYGRDNEVNTLLQAFERVSEGAAEMMLVAGYSGVGKTALVHEVHKPMTEKHGYFAAGKFDQYQRNIPYSALSSAFNEFGHYLLTEPTEQLNSWRDKILTAVGNNGQVLIDVIPQLELIIGKQPPITQVGSTEAQNRFNLVFQQFFRVICQKEHPLVLFIDDLQWADLPSLNLLETLMTDINNQYFLIIGAYRDNEVDVTHPLMMMIKELIKTQTTVHTIQLQNLSGQNVNTLIADMLGGEPVSAHTLTDLVYEKTQGNAFFTREFLKSLYAQELLVFDWQSQKWQWDVESIASKQMTDNVVVLMAQSIEQLPTETLNVLKLAACIGNGFDLQTLSIIAQQPPKDTLAALWIAIEKEFVLLLDDNYKQLSTQESVKIAFKFQHDRVQQAAYSLIRKGQQQTIHLQMGRLLLAHLSNEEESLFEIVNQFNQARELIDDEAEKLKLAKLNLMAGLKAKTATAYQPAFDYLRTAIGLLTPDAWQQHYDLSLQIYTSATEAAFLNTDFKHLESWQQIILQQANTLFDKAKVYDIQIQSHLSQNQPEEAVKIALTVLKQLDIHFPDNPTHLETQLALSETQSYLTETPIDTLYHLPLMTAPDQLVAMQILGKVLPAAYIAVPQLYPLMTVEMVNLSLKYGNTKESTYGYTCYGSLLCNVGGDIDRGFQFGKLGFRLVERLNAKEFKAKVIDVFGFFIVPQKEHLKNTLKLHLEQYLGGLEVGDILFASYGVFPYFLHSFLVGKELTSIALEIPSYNPSLVKLKQEAILNWNKLCQQVVLNLIGPPETSVTFPPYHLKGMVYDEDKMLPILTQANDILGLAIFYFYKLVLCVVFQAYPQAIENAAKLEKDLEWLLGAVIVPLFYFYDSLARLAMYSDELSSEEQQSLLNRVTTHQEKLAKLAETAPMNYQHKYDLVEAEKARVLGQQEAIEWYEKAIAGAKENQYLQEEALAYELAAKFYLGRNLEKFAQTYMKEAHYRYQQWGALAKVTNLEKQYPQWLTQKTTPAMPALETFTSIATVMGSATQRITTSSRLDLDSIMKAAQTLSGEIVLSRLLEKMMHIVIENAGASIGFLLLPQHDNWFIEAKGQVDIDEVKVLQSHPIDNQPIAKTIIQYVERTQENVILNNASVEGQFTRDAHLISQHPQSVLCAPLINQGRLIGILYLENNLTTGAFTPERLQVLQVISSQLAISIENALLYRTLEQKVEERTAQLADANQEITALNDKLKEENLRMSAELEVSRQLQQMLLPTEKELEQIDGLDIKGFMEPADEVGGDYYDVLYQDGRVLIGIGDVTGHGLESGALAIMVQSAVRTLLASYQELDSVKFLTALNQMIYHNVIRMNAEKSLTLALLSYQDGQLVLTGQHEEMIVVRKGEVELIETLDLGFYLGLEEDIAAFINQVTVPLNQGDVVVLYTDGITEAVNTDKEEYRLERLCQIVKHNWQRTADEIREAVINDVRQFIGTQKVFDDITLLVLKQQ